VVQNATFTLEDDVATTTRVIDAQDGPVILVGHSYGGAVITEAGTHDKVAALVYIAAFAPDKGESVNTLIADPPRVRRCRRSCRPKTASCSSTGRSLRRRSPTTYSPNKRRSWPTPRSLGCRRPARHGV